MKRLLVLGVALLVVACSDGSATRYVGTVMNEAVPDSAGSLRLTLFTRTDSSFGGVIELGPPAQGTGTAHAWFEGHALHVLTVGAESGDTIHWTSPLADTALGGRFEVTGGPRTGQQGTWRAHLAYGPPATLATLRSPQPRPVPPLLSIWPLLLLLGAALGVRGWIIRAPGAAVPVDGSPSFPSASRRPAIGGWLAIYALGQLLALVLWVLGAETRWHDFTSTLAVGTAVTGLQPLIVLEAAMWIISLPLVVGGLVLLARRSPYTPRYWFSYHAATAAYVLADIAAMMFIHPQMVRLFGAQAVTGVAVIDARRRQYGVAAAALMWMLYWVRSRRVRATFGAAALDRAVEVTPGTTMDAAVPVQSAAPRRLWPRVVFRIVATGIAVTVGAFAIGLWTTHVSPYSVPEGRDIRAVVAGRWTWNSDTAGCRRAHTIAFAEGGKLMTITGGGIDPAHPAVYDILAVTRSSIRGAIRGEKRLAKDGKPVVWDLVLTGPDEYRWQRTDWTPTPWSYTGSIRRCRAPSSASAADVQVQR